MLTTLAHQYQAASAGWMTAALAYALHLFYLLVAIEIPVSAIFYLFYKEGLADFLAALLIKLLALLFFWVLMQEAPTWIPAILQSFTQAGAGISGTTTLDPSSVFAQGINVATAMLTSINNASIFSAFLLIVIAGLCAVGIVLAYAVIAAQLLITLVESYLVMGGGVLMLGFAGSRWTLVFTERYFGYVVSVGIKLFVLYLIIGLGGTLATQWAAAFTAAQGTFLPQPQAYLDVMGGALVFMAVGWQVPALAAAMMTGSPALTLSTAASTASLLTTAVANGVAKGMQQTTASTRQATDTLASAVKLGQAAKSGIGEARQGGADLTTAVRKTAGDISRAASQQFRDAVIRGAGRESARHAAETAGSQAVQGWGQNTTLGNLTNRVYANRVLAPPQPENASNHPDRQAASAATTTRGPSTRVSVAEKQSGSAPPKNTPTDRPPSAPAPTESPRRSINTITPPPIPHDSGHGGGITIRFNLPE